MLPPEPTLAKYIDDLMLGDLLAFRDFWFAKLLELTWLVAIGLGFEGPELVVESLAIVRHWGFVRRFDFSLPLDEVPHAVKLLAFVGWFVIIVGVAGEAYTDGRVSDTDAAIQSFFSINLANAERESTAALNRSATAELEASLANEHAAQLGKEAEQLRKDAETERLERAKIEASVAWRHLNEKEQDNLGTALTRFGQPNRSAGVWSDLGDTEAASFANDIAKSLRIARIITPTPTFVMRMKGGGGFTAPISAVETGVFVQSTSDAVAHEMGDSIVDELNARGFDAAREPDSDEPTTPPLGISQHVWVHVGPRPEGAQGKYKLQAEREAKAKKQTKNK